MKELVDKSTVVTGKILQITDWLPRVSRKEPRNSNHPKQTKNGGKPPSSLKARRD